MYKITTFNSSYSVKLFSKIAYTVVSQSKKQLYRPKFAENKRIHVRGHKFSHSRLTIFHFKKGSNSEQ